MEASSSSFVSKARTALHSAAAKAERVFTDIKSDLVHDRDSERKSPASISKQPEDEVQEDVVKPKGNHETKHLRWKPPPISIGTKQEWQDKLKNIRLGRKEVNEIEKVENLTMSFPIYDENLSILYAINDAESKVSDAVSLLENLISGNVEKIPSSSVIKQLAVAIENGKKFNSMKDFLISSRDSSPVKERAGLALSAVKSLVLREKDEKMKSEPGEDEKIVSLIQLLFNSEDFLRRNVSCGSESAAALAILKDIHAAPPDTFIVKLAEVIGSLKTMRKMALFWCQVIANLRRLWHKEQYIACIPLDQTPDLNCCPLYQQLQVMNCCVSRKRRHSIASEALDTTIWEASSKNEDPTLSNGPAPMKHPLFVRVNTGEAVLRLGADHPSGDLIMLETGEPVYSPVTQECPLFTEDLIKETEEFVLRTGSVGAGCSQLLSDMQAFKAANPGCILEDFVRWHSPPDWTEAGPGFDEEDLDGSTRGQLSNRMQKKGNLWRELWETAKPVPAVKQTPIYDKDLAVEGILDFLDDIPPLKLFEQLFVSLLGVGFVIAEASMASDSDLSKLFYECKDYVVAACQASVSEKVDDLCQVYETIETMVLKPEELLKTMKQPEDTGSNPVGELRRRFKRLTLNFGNKDKNLREQEHKTQKSVDGNAVRQSLGSFFDSKSSLFSKKPPKPGSVSPAEKSTLQDDSDWTIV